MSILNFEEGLSRMAGKTELYCKLLNLFKSKYGQSAASLNDYLISDEVDKALFLVHSVLGVAGSISAQEVWMIASRMEKALIDRDIKLAEKELAELTLAIEQVLPEIDLYLNKTLKSI